MKARKIMQAGRPRRAFLIAAALCAFPASAQPPDLLEAAARILEETTGTAVRPYSTRDFGRERYSGARSVLVPESGAERLLLQVRRKIPRGMVAFVGVTHNLSRPKPAGVELVVAIGTSQFDIVRVAATDGINYGLDTEGIVKELESWDKEYGVDIWQAESDVVQLRLKTQPKDLQSFANRVYKFCPDIVDQGVGNADELAKLIAKEKAVFLWWD
jgi:hypothetical protein